MPNSLHNAFNALNVAKKDKEVYIPGLLGAAINGSNQVEVPGRAGYVYVRIHSNLSEIVQVYNDKVSPVYGLPVLVIRDDVDTTRYRIYGRDTGAYENWQSATNYVPVHGNQHSFNPDNLGGGDIVWVYDRQFMPLLVYPSGTNGAGMVMIAPDLIWHNSAWMSVGGTGTSSLLTYKPTGSNASLVLVSIDAVGNPKLTLGSSVSVAVTGGYALFPYLPTPANTDIPLAAVRLVSGTSLISWDNLYDLRSFANELTAASTGTSSGADTWELQTFYNNTINTFTSYAKYSTAQSVILRKVVIYYYTGVTGTTDWVIYNSGISTLDSWSTPATDSYDVITRTLDEPLTAGKEINVETDANVADMYTGYPTITFIVEKA